MYRPAVTFTFLASQMSLKNVTDGSICKIMAIHSTCNESFHDYRYRTVMRQGIRLFLSVTLRHNIFTI